MGFIQIELDEETHKKVKAAAALAGEEIKQFVAKACEDRAKTELKKTSE